MMNGGVVAVVDGIEKYVDRVEDMRVIVLFCIIHLN